MSYLFDGSNHTLKGTLNTAQNLDSNGVTMALWYKSADINDTADYIYSLHRDTSLDEVIALIGQSADTWRVISIDTVGGASTANYASSAGEYDGVWVPIVCVFASESSRVIYVESRTNSGSNSNSRDTGANLAEITIGEAPNGAADLTQDVYLAEIALWDKALSDSEIDDYLAGNAASGVAASNLRGYWPLTADNSTQTNEGLDTGGDLTVTNAVYDSDHPTITSGSNTDILVPTGPWK